VWSTTADEIAEYYIANHYDTYVDYIRSRRPEAMGA
jgi:hypothetical protein